MAVPITGSEAVSYTHLDVYKRQGRHIKIVPCPQRKGKEKETLSVI